MQGLKKLLLMEEHRLRRIVNLTKKQLKTAPEGTLKVSKNKEKIQYYQMIPGVTKKSGSYIHKDNIELVKRLAQKVYNKKLLRLAEKRLSQIKKLAKEYEDNEIEQIYYHESKEKQNLIQPIEPTWEQQLEAWKAIEYDGKGFEEGTAFILSERGERVRSKTEKILADYFFRNNIPYHYEKPLNLSGYGTIYPDFTFLSPKTRKEIYWEHEGMMTNPAYAQSAVKKISTYLKNDIFPGENLILTFETDTWVLNTKEIELLVRRYLI